MRGKAAWAFFTVIILRVRRSKNTNIMDKVHRLFSVVFTPSPPPPRHRGSVWVIPVIFLLLTNTIYQRRGHA
jgi:hypothetical protein